MAEVAVDLQQTVDPQQTTAGAEECRGLAFRPEVAMRELRGLDFRNLRSYDEVAMWQLPEFDPLPLASDGQVTYFVMIDPDPLDFEDEEDEEEEEDEEDEEEDEEEEEDEGDEEEEEDEGDEEEEEHEEEEEEKEEEEKEEEEEAKNHPHFVQLLTHANGSTPPPPENLPPQPPFPRIVFPIGYLVKCSGPPDDNQYASWEQTNYAVVIDPVWPGNPLWLVYNRHPIDRMLTYDRIKLPPEDLPLVFPGARLNPDSVCVMDRLDQWDMERPENLLEPSRIGAAINTRGRVGAVTAREVTRAQVCELLGHAAAYGDDE